VIRHVVSLYEFPHHTYKGEIGNGLYLESCRSQIQGVPIETVVVAHLNERAETDSVVINRDPKQRRSTRPLPASHRDCRGAREDHQRSMPAL
jgi:hypothetical protein